MNRLREWWNREETPEEIEIEREKAIVFDNEAETLSKKCLKLSKKNARERERERERERDERTYIDKEGDEIVSSYRIFLLAQNACGFNSGVALKPLDKETTEKKNRLQLDITIISVWC